MHGPGRATWADSVFGASEQKAAGKFSTAPGEAEDEAAGPSDAELRAIEADSPLSQMAKNVLSIKLDGAVGPERWDAATRTYTKQPPGSNAWDPLVMAGTHIERYVADETAPYLQAHQAAIQHAAEVNIETQAVWQKSREVEQTPAITALREKAEALGNQRLALFKEQGFSLSSDPKTPKQVSDHARHADLKKQEEAAFAALDDATEVAIGQSAVERMGMEERSDSADKAVEQAKSHYVEARRAAIQEALSAIRPMGWGAAGPPPLMDHDSFAAPGRQVPAANRIWPAADDMRRAMAEFHPMFPQDWWDDASTLPASAGEGPIRVGRVTVAYTDPTTPEVNLSNNGLMKGFYDGMPEREKLKEDTRVGIHEWGHMMEFAVPGLTDMMDSFLATRTDDGQGRQQSTHHGCIKDGFAHEYVGRQYDKGMCGWPPDKRPTEVFSMGMEDLWSDGFDTKRKDPEHYRMMLGALALLGRKPKPKKSLEQKYNHVHGEGGRFAAAEAYEATADDFGPTVGHWTAHARGSDGGPVPTGPLSFVGLEAQRQLCVSDWKALGIQKSPLEFANGILAHTGLTADQWDLTYSEAHTSEQTNAVLEFSANLLKGGQRIGAIEFGLPSKALHGSMETGHLIGLMIDPALQQHGTAKHIMQNWLSAFKLPGIKQLNMECNISVGGYCWAKYGVVPTDESWEQMGRQIRFTLDPRSRYDADNTFADKIEAARPPDEFQRTLLRNHMTETWTAKIPPATVRHVVRLAQRKDPKTMWRISDLTLPIEVEETGSSELYHDDPEWYYRDHDKTVFPRAEKMFTKRQMTLGRFLLMQHHWYGSLDFTDPEAMRRTTAYLARESSLESALKHMERAVEQKRKAATAERDVSKEARDAAGKWTAAGDVAYDKDRGKGHEWHNPKTGKDHELANKVHPMPAWTDVQINLSPNPGQTSRGRDERGLIQYTWSKEWVKGADKRKWERHERLLKVMDKIVGKMRSDMKGDGPDRENATALYLIASTGIRVGGKSKRSTSLKPGEEEHYGATTLLAQHVKVKGTNIKLDFIGKHGVQNHRDFSNALLAPAMQRRIDEIKPTEKMFDTTNDSKLNDYLHRLHPAEAFHVKDFRMVYGTDKAWKVASSMPVPKTLEEFQASRDKVGLEVSEALNNDKDEALKSYISPKVWDIWKAASEMAPAPKVKKPKGATKPKVVKHGTV